MAGHQPTNHLTRDAAPRPPAGKQLNYIAGVVAKPVAGVKEPVEWVGRAAETTTTTVQSVTSTSIRRVVDDVKALAGVSWLLPSLLAPSCLLHCWLAGWAGWLAAAGHAAEAAAGSRLLRTISWRPSTSPFCIPCTSPLYWRRR